MNPKILSFFRHYLAGLLTAAWNGAIGAIAGILGIDGAALTGASSDSRVLNWHEMGAAFVGAFILHGIFWLKSHPLPENWDSTMPFFPVAKPVVPKDPPSNLPETPNN